MSNVIDFAAYRNRSKPKPVVTTETGAETVISALIDWGTSMGVDVSSDKFTTRLTDFMTLMQLETRLKETA